MSNSSWYYFLSIEKDFVRTINFVELHTANSKAFSNEYAKLLLLLGSETDVVAKMLCNKIEPAKRAENIDDYRAIITTKFPGMHTIEIDIPRYGLKIKPWVVGTHRLQNRRIGGRRTITSSTKEIKTFQELIRETHLTRSAACWLCSCISKKMSRTSSRTPNF